MHAVCHHFLPSCMVVILIELNILQKFIPLLHHLLPQVPNIQDCLEKKLIFDIKDYFILWDEKKLAVIGDNFRVKCFDLRVESILIPEIISRADFEERNVLFLFVADLVVINVEIELIFLGIEVISLYDISRS